MKAAKLTHGGPRRNQTGRPPLPPGQKRICLPVHLQPENLEWLRAEAGRRGKSLSETVNELIRAEREVRGLNPDML